MLRGLFRREFASNFTISSMDTHQDQRTRCINVTPFWSLASYPPNPEFPNLSELGRLRLPRDKRLLSFSVRSSSMLTLCMLRGLFAVTLAALWLFVLGSGTAQEILKELEQGERQHGDDHAGHKHGHDSVPGMEKTSTEPKEPGAHKHATAAPGAHSGHKHTTRHNPKGHGDHQHSVAQPAATGRKNINTRCVGSSARIRSSGKALARAGCPTRLLTSECMPPMVTGRRCITRSSTSCTTTKAVHGVRTRHS